LAEDVPRLFEVIANAGRKTYQMGGTVGVLKIDVVSANDASTYTCVASNAVETVTADAELEISEGSL
jgi:hypothetical protein